MNRREFLTLAAGAVAAGGLNAAEKTKVAAQGSQSANTQLFRVNPHLQLLGEASFGIVWMTSKPATGWAEWSQDGGKNWTKVWTETDGLRDANGLLHKAIVEEGYDPKKPLVYRAHSRAIDAFRDGRTTYDGDEVIVERKLEAVIREDGSISFLFFNDIHDIVKTYPLLLKQITSSASFNVFAGDILNSVSSEGQVVDHLLSPMAEVSEKTGAACWYLRGNHETRGPMARQLRNYLALKDGHYYGAVTIGSARILFIDSGEDKGDDWKEKNGTLAYGGLVDFDHYLEKQREFVLREIASDEWKRAGVRLVITHIPACFPYENNEKVWWRNMRAPRLNKFFRTFDDANVTLMIAGHIHRCTYGDAYTKVPKTAKRYRTYPIVAGGGPIIDDKNELSRPTVGRITVKGTKVEVSFVNVDGKTVLSRTYSG